MGIYDRDYYRREGPSFLGGLDHGRVCAWIIGINIVFYVIQMATMRSVVFPGGFDGDEIQQQFHRGGEPFLKESPVTNWLDLDVPKVLHGQIWRLLTHAFLHDTSSIWHIVWNMLILWWFGRDMEDLYGWREFLAFYLVSALVGGLAFSAAFVAGIYNGPALGASGAVTAVVTLFACHFPTRVILVFFVLPVPIWIFVLITIAKDSFDVLGRTNNGIAAAAHLGGAAFAFLYNRQHWRLLSFVPNLKAMRKRQSQPRLRVYREAEEDRPAPVGVTVTPPAPQGRPEDEQLEAKMDAVLEKISRFGKENLTDSDREVLRLAAEAIKRRRS
jgi:membrane associated rhomboid family serine protease